MLPITSLVIFILMVASCSALPASSSEEVKVCTTEACNKTAERILSYMDPAIKPCDDFYQFTCGKYQKSELPQGKKIVSSFSQVQEFVNKQIREMLEEPARPDEHDGYRAAKRFYSLCINDQENFQNSTEASNLARSSDWQELGGWREDHWAEQHLENQQTRARNPEELGRRQNFDKDKDLEAKEPWERCVQIVTDSNLDLAVSSMYAQRYMTEDKRELVRKITYNLREQMYSIIQAQEWMDEITKTKALLKLCRMREYIAYPDETIDTAKMDEFYKGLNLEWLTDFKTARILVSNWLTTFGYDNLKRTDSYYWVRHGQLASTVGAFYNRKANWLHLTAALLQPPIFRDTTVPAFIYYSTVGLVTGHEITHGFDKLGFNFDAEGGKNDWMSESSKVNFTKKSECLLNQYRDFVDKCNSEKEMENFPYLAGNRSLGELIADNAGLKIAYFAYQNFTSHLASPEPLLPGLETYTRDQMFFIGLGNLWCFLEDKTQRPAPLDVHPPSEYRTNGVLRNFPKFSEAFGCQPGTNLRPESVCSVW